MENIDDCPIKRCKNWNPEKGQICQKHNTCEECKYTFQKICEVCEEPTCELSHNYQKDFCDGTLQSFNPNFEF